LGDVGAVLGVVLGVVLGSPPAGGEIFLRAVVAIGWRPGRANSDHGPRKTEDRRAAKQGRNTRRQKGETNPRLSQPEREREREREGEIKGPSLLPALSSKIAKGRCYVMEAHWLH
jgi:hypothetical protein